MYMNGYIENIGCHYFLEIWSTMWTKVCSRQ